jgi:hypothetical protein
MAFHRLPETVQTLYAELLDQTLRSNFDEGAGSFVSKQLGGARYWYRQRVDGGSKRQVYLGRETEELLERVRTAREDREAALADERRRRELVSMLAAGGAARESGAVVQVLRILSDAGVFRLGGVLIGTQAFSCHANLLGVRFDAQSLRTADIDVAQPAIAVPRDSTPTNMLDELRSADTRFVAVPSFDARDPSTSFRVRGRDLRVDFLTPATSRTGSRPVYLPHIGTAAEPMAGLEYLIVDAIPAVVVGGEGVLVHVPTPARFALHKLWVARQRPVSEQTKARKDLRQAEQLLEVLAEDRPDDLARAWKSIRPAMRRTVAAALARLPEKLARDVKTIID